MALSDLQLLRIKIGDTGTTNLFTDDELNGLISKYTNISLAAYHAVGSIIASASLGASLTEGAYSRTHNLNALLEIQKRLETEVAAAGLEINGEDTAYFEIAEEIYSEDNAEQIITNAILKDEL